MAWGSSLASIVGIVWASARWSLWWNQVSHCRCLVVGWGVHLHLHGLDEVLEHVVLLGDLTLDLTLLGVYGLKLLSLILLLADEVFLKLVDQLNILVGMVLKFLQDRLLGLHLRLQVLLIPDQSIDLPIQGHNSPLDRVHIHVSLR